MLVMVMGVWVTGRAMLWENPFPIELPSVEQFFAEADRTKRVPIGKEALADARRAGQHNVLVSAYAPTFLTASLPDQEKPLIYTALPTETSNTRPLPPMIAGGHQFLMAAAFRVDWNAVPTANSSAQQTSPQSPSLMPPVSLSGASLDRWSLDAFAFYRAGSGNGSISQGRSPVYGASQASANLQYRIAPRSEHDPRAYLRAYRAFVAAPENEAAFGLSARPLGNVPVRVAAELRVTDGPSGTDLRPAAYAVTELAPQSLPLAAQLEAYGAAGYVGGDAATPFADGQLAVTRKVFEYDGVSDEPVRLSLGAGAWGGIQEDANRLDVGPTLRLDVSVGDIPARVSVDWRERVAGDAEPNSGIAATLSTRF